jgi:hypothetical protein
VGWNAFWIIAAYVVLRPLPPFFGTSAPRTLSVGLTVCSPSGLSKSSFLPSSGKVRPAADISTGLSGGPTACEAAEALVMVTASGATVVLVSAYQMCALGSRLPNGLTPLNSFCARPLKKLRWL